jgi:hypothetical protein
LNLLSASLPQSLQQILPLPRHHAVRHSLHMPSVVPSLSSFFPQWTQVISVHGRSSSQWDAGVARDDLDFWVCAPLGLFWSLIFLSDLIGAGV